MRALFTALGSVVPAAGDDAATLTKPFRKPSSRRFRDFRLISGGHS
jgi:hypothetical protein